MTLEYLTTLLATIAGIAAIFGQVHFNPGDRPCLDTQEAKTAFGTGAFFVMGSGLYLLVTAMYLTKIRDEGVTGFSFFGLVGTAATIYMAHLAPSFERKLRVGWLGTTMLATWLKAESVMRPGGQPMVDNVQHFALGLSVGVGILAVGFTTRDWIRQHKASAADQTDVEDAPIKA